MIEQTRHTAQSLFELLMDLQSPQRTAMLELHCAGDPELRNEVESLLRFHDRAGDFLESPPIMAPGEGSADLPEKGPLDSGKKIGHFTVLGVLGAGGMGMVYLAESERPRRRVALKVIKPGIASASVLRRFEHEAEVLGLLQHPGIAQIFEAGTADSGAGPQPFFAMELVEGLTLTEYIGARSLGTPERLMLFVKVCDAVQHAHQKGVIHRDLKPGNILVDPSGQPKILDFGVARLTDADAQLTMMHTGIGQLIGTLSYMSPEQVTSDPGAIDTRSDVYALGVVLYELLTGRVPHEASRRSVPEVVRSIKEDDPTPLSSVNRVFRGDIETIVGKALEKDRDRRYQSASDLAGDIRRFLADEPIVARPPSARYQLRKFARRNKVLVGGALVVFLVLTGAVTVVSLSLVRVMHAESRMREEADNAKRQERLAEEISAFLGITLSGLDPATAQKHDTTLLRIILQKAADKLNASGTSPEVEASIRATIGEAYFRAGMTKDADAELTKAWTLARGSLGPVHPTTMSAEDILSEVYQLESRSADNEKMLTEALAVRRQELGPEHAETLQAMNNLSVLYNETKRNAQAEELCVQALQTRRRLLGDDDPLTVQSMANLAGVFMDTNRLQEAEDLFVKVVEFRKRVLGEAEPKTLQAMNNLASVYDRRSEPDKAGEMFADVLRIRRDALPGDHPYLLISINNLAGHYEAQKQYELAEPLYLELVEKSARVWGERHPYAVAAPYSAGRMYNNWKKFDKAEPLLTQAVENARKFLPPEHDYTPAFLCARGICYSGLGRYEDAERDLLESNGLLEGRLPVENGRRQSAIRALVHMYELWGRDEGAEKWRAMVAADPAK